MNGLKSMSLRCVLLGLSFFALPQKLGSVIKPMGDLPKCGVDLLESSNKVLCRLKALSVVFHC